MHKWNLQLQFPTNDTDEDEGLADAGIETFKGAPYSSVARESGQNSRDAVREFPVRMRFDVVEIRKDEFPDFDELAKTIDACVKRANERRDLKEIQFFDKAKRLLGKDVIVALRISDEGTTGLIGPSVAGKPFHSLLKGSGVSNKNDPTSGGSFGIGKRAAFAVSDLHTVFYCTLYEEMGTRHYLAQGKCTLVSHELGGTAFKATGWWGREKYQPVDDASEVPQWLRRDTIGTTAFSLGFSKTEDWKHKIAESLVRNFFAAIHRAELEFFIDDGAISINRATLPGVLDSADVAKAAASQGTEEDFEFSKQLYECLVDSNTKQFSIEIPEVGSFVMHLLVKEDLPKRVAIIRNGMMIADNLQKFGDKLAHFPMYKDFVAIVEPSDARGKTILKRLENPEHNDLSVDRLIDESEQKTVRKGMNSLKRWIRESIKSEAFIAPKDEVTLEEMNEFFGDISNADRIPSAGEGDTHPLVVTYKPLKPKRQAVSEGGLGEEEEGGGGERNDSEGGDSSGEGNGGGDGTGGHSGELLAFDDFRNVLDPKDPGTRRELFFTPAASGLARVKILAKGMNNDVALSGTKFFDSKGVPMMLIQMKAGERMKFTAQLPSAYLGPISMLLHKAAAGEQSHEVA